MGWRPGGTSRKRILFLDVGDDQQEVHGLGGASPGEAETAGEIGVVGEFAGIDPTSRGAGERELANDAGRVASLRGSSLVPVAAAETGARAEGNDELSRDCCVLVRDRWVSGREVVARGCGS